MYTVDEVYVYRADNERAAKPYSVGGIQAMVTIRQSKLVTECLPTRSICFSKMCTRAS